MDHLYHGYVKQPEGKTCSRLITEYEWVTGTQPTAKLLDQSFLKWQNKQENPILVGGLEHEFMTFHSVGNFIIPSDELIFFRGVGEKPPTSIYSRENSMVS